MNQDDRLPNIQENTQVLNNFLNTLDIAGDRLATIVVKIQTEIEIIDHAGHHLNGKLEDFAQTLQEDLVDLETKETEAIEAIDTWEQLYTDAQENVDSFADDVESSQETLSAEIDNNLDEFTTNIENLKQGLTEFSIAAVQEREEIATADMETQSVLNEFMQEFAEFPSQAEETKSTVEFAYEEFSTAIGEESMTQLGNVLQKFDEQINEADSNVVNNLQSLIDNLRAAIDEYSQKVVEIGSNFQEQATDIFQQLKEYIANTLKEKMEEAFDNIDSEIIAELNTEIDQFIETMEQGADVIQEIPSLMNEIEIVIEEAESMSSESNYL